MNKREYFRDRNRLIKKYEKGEITYSDFTREMSELASHFKPRWGNELSSKGMALGEKITTKMRIDYLGGKLK